MMGTSESNPKLAALIRRLVSTEHVRIEQWNGEPQCLEPQRQRKKRERERRGREREKIEKETFLCLSLSLSLSLLARLKFCCA